MNFNYIKDPLAIEQESFRRIRALTRLQHLDPDQQQIAIRLVHTCGDPTIIDRLYFSENAVAAGLAALRSGAPILCDVEMVRHGLTRRLLQNPTHCFLNEPQIPALAKAREETRTMAALTLWRPLLAGSIVLIGNAPTALFRLLEMLAGDADRPALIIGMPVGFVGAAESKSALREHHRSLDTECMTLHGHQGGSALTAAACNALLRIDQGVRF